MSDYLFEFDSTKRKAAGERVAAAAADFRAQVEGDEARSRVEMAVEAAARSRARDKREIAQAYVARDLAPPEGDYPVSLDFLLLHGWTIETYAGRAILVRPLARMPVPPHRDGEGQQT